MSEQQSDYIDNYYTRDLPDDTRYPPVSGDEAADVCVIGGGLAGLNTALGLIERGKNVILIEQHRIGWGASGRNAGFVAKGYAAGEASLVNKFGLEKAQQLVSLTKNARKIIKKRIGEFGIDCEPVRDGVLTVSFKDNADDVKKYIDDANANFDLGFEFWSRDQVRDICKNTKYYDGVFSKNDFQFNPLRYVRGLAKAIADKGGRVFEDSAALEIKKSGPDWVIHTEHGRIKAQHVVLCCAIYSDGLDKRLENAAFPVRTYLMTTKPIKEKVLKSAIDTEHAIYDMRFCSDFYRTLSDNRLMWGGRVSLWGCEHDIAAAMIKDMYKLYPQLEGHVKPETAWSGLLCYAPHKMPQIGEIEPGYWYNTGYGGHGLCPTTAGGEIVAAAIASNDKTYELFEPFGISYAGGHFGRYAAQMVYWLWKLRDFTGI